MRVFDHDRQDGWLAAWKLLNTREAESIANGERQGVTWLHRWPHPKIHIGHMMKRVLRGEFKRTVR